jgi:spore germination protein KA/spore germination protein
MSGKKDRYKQIINGLMNTDAGISCRTLKSAVGDINILYIKQITDVVSLSDNIIKPLVRYVLENKLVVNSEIVMSRVIYAYDCKKDNDENKINEYLLGGMTLVFLPNDSDFLVLNIKKVEQKSIQNPELTYTIRGPRDCFTENLDVNISLIRYRIKDKELKTETFEVGRRTKTRVALVYISDIANDKVSKIIRERINNIDTDGIIESGELQKELLNSKFSLFPQMGLVERSDMAAGALLEGKVIVISEGSGIALVAPKTFGEFFWSCDDVYDNQYTAFVSRNFRILAAFFSVSLTSLFIIVSSFQHDILPADYITTLAVSRSGVPWNAFTGVLLIEIILEILREALLRVPKQIGSAIGIVGGITIGQAAISAGIFSPLLLILASLSLMSSFVIPDYSIMNPLRIAKFFLIIITGVLDLYGFTLGLCFLLTNIISTNSFGVPYLAPFAPFNWSDIMNTFYYNKKIVKNRPHFLRTKDNIRTKEQQ